MKILVIDDDAGLRKSLSLILSDAGYQVISADSGSTGLSTAEGESPDLILCDVRMPGMTGLEFLERYRSEGGDALVLVMTAYGSMDLAVEAMGKGAYDYIAKPFGAEEVLLVVRKAEERERLYREVGRLRTEVAADKRFGDFVAKSPAMLRALEIANKVAKHPSPVLVTGDSGTGKELMARFIHRESPRASRPFVPVNCGAIPENLLESEFFGYEKGAFSGADRDKDGLFKAAEGGTLFLDEIGELPQPLQVKLLRALQEGEIRRLGGTEIIEVDVRIVSATNRDLTQAIEDGEFREDLYYRLAVVPIHLPPLRERTDEVPELVRFLMDRHGERLSLDVRGISPAALEVLLAYAWPGNIRELENVLERAMLLTESDELDVDDIPTNVRNPTALDPGFHLDGDNLSVKFHSAALEKQLIRRALERTGGNKAKAAELLELSSRALRYKIQDYSIE